MTKAVIIEKNGGPEELKLIDVTVGQPGPGEIRIRHKAVGLNFIDVYQRSGVYALPMPLHLGMEASGIIEAVGEGVTHLKVGDRAAYASQPPGSYCEERVMPAKCVCILHNRAPGQSSHRHNKHHRYLLYRYARSRLCDC
jgi:NADPH2:quinone reductase